MMRTNILIAIILSALAVIAQNEVISKIAKAISSGAHQDLMEFFDSSVEISTPDSEGVYSQNQALQVLKTFFNKYQCSSFEISHTGNSAGGSKFVVGSYVSGGSSFRVSIFLKKVDNDYFIQEFSFEE